MPACAEADELVGVRGIWLSFVERSFESADVDQKLFRCGFACIGMCAQGRTVGMNEVRVNMPGEK